MMRRHVRLSDKNEMNQADGALYFPVQDVTYKELHDWDVPSQKFQLRVGTVVRRRHERQKSKSAGTLVDVNEEKVALFRHSSTVFAINERCPHAGGPLHVGDIETLPDMSVCVRCPWHSWRFDLYTGQVVQPAGRNVKATVYPVKVKADGTIMVGFKSFSPTYFNCIADD